MPDLHFSSALPILPLLALIVLALAISVWTYRVTVPPVSRLTRWTLASLRSAALILLLVLLGEPILSLRHFFNEPPVVMLLLDDSRSMSLADRLGNRGMQVRGVLASSAITRLGSGAEIRAVRFARDARPMDFRHPDSLTFEGAVTDLSAAMRSVQSAAEEANVRAVILVSDGVATAGPNPVYAAETLGLPVFTVGVGDTIAQKDLVVRNVQTNAIAYAGSKVPFRITLQSAGAGGERVEVFLRSGEKIIDRTTIVLERGEQEYTTTLHATPAGEGRQMYSADASTLPGELTTRNNHAETSVQVLRSKMKVTMVSGGPSPDDAFMRRVLESDSNIALRPFTENAEGGFLEGPLTPASFEQCDVAVLVGYPRAVSDRGALAIIRQAGERDVPIFSLLGRTVDAAKLSELTPILPFTISEPRSVEMSVFAVVAEAKIGHALLNVGDKESSLETWKRLPPIFRWQSGFRAKPESEVLASVRVGGTMLNEPLILSRSVTGRKSIAVTGYGIWRWKMLADDARTTERTFDIFMSNAIRWLTARDDQRRIRIHPARDRFTAAEPVEFIGDIYDESFRPIVGAEVSATVTGVGRTWEIAFTEGENGQYQGLTDPLPEGTYAYTARVAVDGRAAGEDRGSFTVGAVTVEYLETRMNKPLLQQIAQRTGGRYFAVEEIQTLDEAVHSAPGFASHERVQTSEANLRNSGWMLGAVVALLAAEWVIRRRKSML